MNILKEQKLMALTERANEMTGDPSLGLEAALVGVNAPFEGATRSVDSLTNALVNSYAGGLIADLRKANLLIKFNNMKGDFERQVANVLGDLNRKNPLGVPGASSDAKALAKILFKYQRASTQRLNQAGAYIRLKEGRVVRASHDQRRMVKVGLDEWKAYIRDKLDYKKMGIAPERIDGFLDSAYEAIVTGVRKDPSGQAITEVNEISRAFKGPANLAKKESAQSVLTFKTPNDWYDYDQKFGRSSLREAFMQDIQSSSRSTALMEILGTNPQAMVDRVRRRLEKKYRGDAKKLKRITRERAAITFEAALAEVTGEVNFGSHTTMAKVFHFIRSIQTMAKLGGAFISAFSDIAFISSNRIYQGRSLMDAWGDAFSAVFKGMKKGEMRDLRIDLVLVLRVNWAIL